MDHPFRQRGRGPEHPGGNYPNYPIIVLGGAAAYLDYFVPLRGSRLFSDTEKLEFPQIRPPQAANIGSGAGREADGVTEALEAQLHALPLQLVGVGDAQFVGGFPAGEDVVDHDQDGVPKGDEGALLAAPCGDAAVLGREVVILGLAGNVGDLNQGLPEGLVALARFAAQMLAATLGVARAHSPPRRRGAGRRGSS